MCSLPPPSHVTAGVPWLPTATGVFLGACMPSEIASETVAALPVHPIGAPDAHTPPRVMMPGGLLSVCAWTAFHDCLQNEVRCQSRVEACARAHTHWHRVARTLAHVTP